jgi:ferredoxin
MKARILAGFAAIGLFGAPVGAFVLGCNEGRSCGSCLIQVNDSSGHLSFMEKEVIREIRRPPMIGG